MVPEARGIEADYRLPGALKGMMIDECRMLIEKDIGKCIGRKKPQRPAPLGIAQPASLSRDEGTRRAQRAWIVLRIVDCILKAGAICRAGRE